MTDTKKKTPVTPDADTLPPAAPPDQGAAGDTEPVPVLPVAPLGLKAPKPLSDEYQRPSDDGNPMRVLKPYPGYVVTRVNTHPMLTAEAEADPGRARVQRGDGYLQNEELCTVGQDGKSLLFTNMYLYAETVAHYLTRKRAEAEEARQKMQGLLPKAQQMVGSYDGHGVEGSIQYREEMVSPKLPAEEGTAAVALPTGLGPVGAHALAPVAPVVAGPVGALPVGPMTVGS